MANIKPLDNASTKWSGRSQAASTDYQSGVQTPRRSWSEAASGAEGNYKQGVTSAAAQGRYGKGIKAAGDAKWKAMASTKGPARYSEGVAIGKDDWSKGFSPYHAAISAITLPTRGPKGDPKNMQRVSVIATTLRNVFEKKV